MCKLACKYDWLVHVQVRQVSNLPVTLTGGAHVQVKQKQAKVGKSLSKNLDRLSSGAERSVRDNRRKGLIKLLSGSRTTG